MAHVEAMRETGAGLMFSGLAVWVVDLLVIFFLPSGVKLGRQGLFIAIIAGLAALGLILITSGYVARGDGDEE